MAYRAYTEYVLSEEDRRIRLSGDQDMIELQHMLDKKSELPYYIVTA